MEAIYLLFSDKEVNTFLPWYPVKDMDDIKNLFEKQLNGRRYCFAICLKDEVSPSGYVHAEDDDTAITLCGTKKGAFVPL